MISIFILPPSTEALRERLFNRGQDEQSVIDKRMAEAVSEMSHYDEFDYVLVNDEFSETLQELSSIVEAQRLRTAKQKVRHQALIESLLSAE